VATFYVYEHWRTDINACFYVGKGMAGRAYNMKKRNNHHINIQNKVKLNGGKVLVKILFSGLTEDMAYDIEKETISVWNDLGFPLANKAIGGGKNSGWKLSKERKSAIGASKKGNTYRLGASLSQETKAKISDSHKGKQLSNKHKKSISASLSGDKNPFFGKKHTELTRAKIAAANKSRVWTNESKEKISLSLKARPESNAAAANAVRGKKKSAEVRARMSEGAKRRWDTWRQTNASCIT